jgi:hypothetical protein
MRRRRRRKSDKDRDSRLDPNNKSSHTSLLIEYIKGGKGSQAAGRRLCGRAKVTPLSKSRGRSSKDHIQITECKGTRKPSYTKRIQLSENVKAIGIAREFGTPETATEQNNDHPERCHFEQPLKTL